MAGRKKLNRSVINVRVAPETPEILKNKAKTLGYLHGKEGATGQLLDAIAHDLIQLIPTEKLLKTLDIYLKKEDTD